MRSVDETLREMMRAAFEAREASILRGAELLNMGAAKPAPETRDEKENER